MIKRPYVKISTPISHNERSMNKVNTKYCTGKGTKPDYRSKMTPQEANCDGIFTTSVPTLKVTGEVVIDGKKYKTLTV